MIILNIVVGSFPFAVYDALKLGDELVLLVLMALLLKGRAKLANTIQRPQAIEHKVSEHATDRTRYHDRVAVLVFRSRRPVQEEACTWGISPQARARR